MCATRGISLLVTTGARGLLVLAQVEQQLSELALCRTLSTAANAFAAEINKLGNSVPAGTSGGGVLSRLEELLGLLAGLGNGLVLLVVVVFVKVVDGLVSSLDSLFLLGLGYLVSVLDGHVSALAPFADDVGFGFVFVGSLVGFGLVW